MIRILRPPTPNILKSKATTIAIKQLIANFSAHPNDAMVFDNTIYGHADVKNTLRMAQHGKCAFCESFVAHVDHGDIEHYRPKAGYRQDLTDDTLQKPGYFWLAYSWENLLFACAMCNRRNKGSWFPLANPSQRAKPTKRNITVEQPLFINPSAESPRRYIRFREHIAYAIKDNVRGRTTIDGLGLNRQGPQPKGLLELRRDVFQMLKTYWTLLRNSRQISQKIHDPENNQNISLLEKGLRRMASKKSQFSAMARDYLISVNFLEK